MARLILDLLMTMLEVECCEVGKCSMLKRSSRHIKKQLIPVVLLLSLIISSEAFLNSCLNTKELKHRVFNCYNPAAEKKSLVIPFSKGGISVDNMLTSSGVALRRSCRVKDATKLHQVLSSIEVNGGSSSNKTFTTNLEKNTISIKKETSNGATTKANSFKKDADNGNMKKNVVPRKRVTKSNKRKLVALEPLENKHKPAPLPPKQSSSKSKRAVSSPKAVAAARVVIHASDLKKLSPQNQWTDLEITPSELRASATLTTGQCFNWVVVQRDDLSRNKLANSVISSSAWGSAHETEWIGAIQNHVLSIRETPTTTMYRVLHGRKDNVTTILKDYFQVEVPLYPLYQQWSQNDERLAKIATVIPGVRILRQNPIECLFSFICSSNNNIPRITKMLSSLREKYGRRLLEVPTRIQDESKNDDPTLPGFPIAIYSFPTLQDLRAATEEELRNMGLGYRAKFIIQTRDLLIECGGEDFLMNLRNQDAESVQNELMKFSGIGRKVADCVALFSLDQSSAIPVDVHVQHIASRDYDPTVLGTAKSLTPTIYKRVGDLFRERFCSYAGWAHSLLFIAELPSFRDVLPDDIRVEMDVRREKEFAKKADAKKKKKEKITDSN